MSLTFNRRLFELKPINATRIIVDSVLIIDLFDYFLMIRATGDSLYIILGVQKTATPDDIKKTYRRVINNSLIKIFNLYSGCVHFLSIRNPIVG